MANTETQAAGAAAAEAADGGLLDQILTQSKIARSDTERTRARDLIAELVAQVSDGAMVVSKDAIGALDARIAEIDRVLSEQLSAVLHAPWSWPPYSVLQPVCLNPRWFASCAKEQENIPRQDMITGVQQAAMPLMDFWEDPAHVHMAVWVLAIA